MLKAQTEPQRGLGPGVHVQTMYLHILLCTFLFCLNKKMSKIVGQVFISMGHALRPNRQHCA